MAEVEDEIVAEGAEIIWVLEQDQSLNDGTVDLCLSVMDALGSLDQGWCVGDGETQPVPGTFDDSPFSVYRGFDMIVPRSTMEIVWTSSHGSPSGNENLEGADVVEAVRAAVADLP
ncbi:MAG: hypothetical protein H6738_23665 [Alphaproteobacteria bacterium]|nr:hypothetical protein [Alphaproteobacteria bacterium]MCB9699805.1 hypothetical protein [Alphaproteobacteria bacterium]